MVNTQPLFYPGNGITMSAFIISLSVVLSILATCVMSYVSMATAIGPWIAPTLVLIALPLVRIFAREKNSTAILALSTSAGSIGGIVATAIGFSFPALYFLDHNLFAAWMAQPIFFASMLAGLTLTAGWLGIWVANCLEHELIDVQKLTFPIGQMIYKMIAAQHQVQKAYELLIGFLMTLIFCLLQDGSRWCTSLIPKGITVMRSVQWGLFFVPALRIDLWPILWAVGFVTGHVIALPLAAGALIKIGILDVAHRALYPMLNATEFLFAVCSGIVLTGVVASFLSLARSVHNFCTSRSSQGYDWKIALQPYRKHVREFLSLFCITILFLTYANFSAGAQVFLILATIIFTYQITLIAGRIGLAPLGRFATFVMIPAMFFFNLDLVQIVFVATFVEICGGVAADVLFGRKLAQLCQVSSTRVKAYQYGGLIIASAAVGASFWILINKFGLGSAELFAYKAQSRQLLIDARKYMSIDYTVVLLGMLLGFVLSRLKINPALVLGGILMPLNLTIGLVIGGLLAWMNKNKEAWYPFWSGVFASNSLWMSLQALW